MEGKTIKSIYEFGSGYTLLVFEDNTASLVEVIQAELITDDMEELRVALFGSEKKPDGGEEKKPDGGGKEKTEEGDMTWEDLQGMKYKELVKLCGENDLDTDPDDYDKSEVDDLRIDIAKECGIKLKEEEKKPDGDDNYTWDDLKGLDEDELGDLIKENDLDVDPDDYDDNENGLRRAIAKECGITPPKKHKKK